MDRRQFVFALAIASSALCGEVEAQQDERQVIELSNREVSNAINDPDWVLVDTRQTDAFNGWKLGTVKRGGHLPGAVDFPASWLDSEHQDKTKILAAALRTKGIEPHRHIVLCSDDPQERLRVADYLRQSGFRHLYAFDLNRWADDESKPLVRYPHFHLLAPPSIVKQLIDGQLPETFERARRVKFAEASWGGEDASYANGHVPQSFHVNTDHFEPPPKWMLGDADHLTQFAKRYGFQVDDTVIVSGEDPTASYRLAIVLRYMGVADVRVLNGGVDAWKAANYPVETKSHPPPIATSFGASIPNRPQLIDEMSAVKTALQTSADFVLVDTRTWAEFTGETSGYKYHSHKGRIPGSVYGQAEFQGPNSLTPYRNIDNTMRNADEIRAVWEASGIEPTQHLSFMCGSGWRAAEVLTFAHVMGLSDASLYSDGWIGWSGWGEEPRNPVERDPIQSGN